MSKQCRYAHKWPYLTRTDAEASLVEIKKKGRGNKKRINMLHVYECPDGGHWHIGRDRLKRTKLDAPASIGPA